MTLPIPKGTQAVVDLYGCTPVEHIDTIFFEALRAAGFTIKSTVMYDFTQGEVTALAVLSQSHAALHTWWEVNYISIDIYSCGLPETLKPQLERVVAILKEAFKAGEYDLRLFERGTGLY